MGWIIFGIALFALNFGLGVASVVTGTYYLVPINAIGVFFALWTISNGLSIRDNKKETARRLNAYNNYGG